MNALEVYALLNSKISDKLSKTIYFAEMFNINFKKCGKIATISADYAKVKSWTGGLNPAFYMDILKLTDDIMGLRPYFTDDIVGYVDVYVYSDTNYTLTKTFKMPIIFDTSTNTFRITTPYYPNGSNIYVSANITYITE